MSQKKEKEADFILKLNLQKHNKKTSFKEVFLL
jgi:hypothetical protein